MGPPELEPMVSPKSAGEPGRMQSPESMGLVARLTGLLPMSRKSCLGTPAHGRGWTVGAPRIADPCTAWTQYMTGPAASQRAQCCSLMRYSSAFLFAPVTLRAWSFADSRGLRKVCRTSSATHLSREIGEFVDFGQHMVRIMPKPAGIAQSASKSCSSSLKWGRTRQKLAEVEQIKPKFGPLSKSLEAELGAIWPSTGRKHAELDQSSQSWANSDHIWPTPTKPATHCSKLGQIWSTTTKVQKYIAQGMASKLGTAPSVSANTPNNRPNNAPPRRR